MEFRPWARRLSWTVYRHRGFPWRWGWGCLRSCCWRHRTHAYLWRGSSGHRGCRWPHGRRWRNCPPSCRYRGRRRPRFGWCRFGWWENVDASQKMSVDEVGLHISRGYSYTHTAAAAAQPYSQFRQHGTPAPHRRVSLASPPGPGPRTQRCPPSPPSYTAARPVRYAIHTRSVFSQEGLPLPSCTPTRASDPKRAAGGGKCAPVCVAERHRGRCRHQTTLPAWPAGCCRGVEGPVYPEHTQALPVRCALPAEHPPVRAPAPLRAAVLCVF